MGRAVCLWLFGCLALASAIPLSFPISEKDIMDMILNAKPEDNDIDPTPIVAETPKDDLQEQYTDEPKKQNLPQPEDLQEIPNENKAQEVKEEKPVTEDLQKTSELLPLNLKDQPNSDPATDSEAEKPEESVPVNGEDQIPTELDVPGETQAVADILFTYQEVAEEEAQADEEKNPVILVADDQIVPLNPEDAPIIIVQEDQITPSEESYAAALPGEDLPFFQDEEEEIFPVNEGEEFPIRLDEDQILVISEDNSDFNLNTNDEDELPVPVTIIELEEDELSQPILSEPLIPGLSNEEPQINADVPSHVISSLNENSSTNDESEAPLYFDIVNTPEPVQFVNSQIMSGDQITNSEAFISDFDLPAVPGNEESVSQLFADPIFRLSPPVYPTEDNYQPRDEMIGVYYIPESNLPIQDGRYENPEMNTNFFVNQGNSVTEVGVMSDDEISTEPAVLMTEDEFPVEETVNAEFVDPEADQSFMNEEQNPLLEDDVINTNEAEVANSEPGLIPEYTLMEENQMPVVPAGEEDLEKIGTVIVLESPDSPLDTYEPTLEIIRLDDSPLNQEPLPLDVPKMTDVIEPKPFDSVIPESLMTPDSQQVYVNEQIVPVAEFSEEGILPINYWIPENENQQPIIFPEELTPRHDLPVFPENWNRDISMPATDESLYPNIPTQYNVAPSYDIFSDAPSSHGPSPPQQPMEEQTRSVFTFPNDEMPIKGLDFMTSSDVPQMPREEIITNYGNDNENMFEQSGHIHIPNEFPQTFRYPNFRNRFNRPVPYELSSVFDMTLQQDYHGPNTFPLNFRRPDFSSQMSSTYFNPYNDRISSFSSVNENIFSDSSITPQDFRQGSNFGNLPKALPNSQNLFFSMFNEPVKMMQDTDEQNMNLRTFQNSPTLMGSDRFNQQEQPYDIQLSFVPFENNYNYPSYTENRPQDISYPYDQQSNAYDTYQGFSYNVPSYGGLNLFNRAGIFSPPSRYDMSFNYGSQNGNDRRFNYPIPTW